MSGNAYTDFLPLDQNKNPGAAVSLDGIIPSPDAPVDSSQGIFESMMGFNFDAKSYPCEPGVAYYRMRGYHAASSSFEHWIVTHPGTANPSGNTLIDIEIEARFR